MNYRCFVVLFTLCGSLLVNNSNAQTNLDGLWALYKNSKPIDRNSEAWQKAGTQGANGNCISGDCRNGYGIEIGNSNGYSVRYQYEGSFKNGKYHGLGIVRDVNGFVRASNFDNGKEVGAYLLVDDGLVSLHNSNGTGFLQVTHEFGFTLAEVLKHQVNSFAGLVKCNCLVPATHYRTEDYEQPYEIRNGYGDYIRTEYRTESHDVAYPGLRNNCNKNVFIKSIYRETNSKTGQYEYYDNGISMAPGTTVTKRPFSAKYNSNIDDVQYMGQYTNGSATMNSATASSASNTDKSHYQSGGNGQVDFSKKPGKSIEVNSYTSTTDFVLRKGDKVSISAVGSIVLGAFSGATGPDGRNWLSDWTYVSSFPYGVLMYSIGNGNWSIAGGDVSFVAGSSGKLNLRINDTDPSDNSGSFKVKVHIVKGK